MTPEAQEIVERLALKPHPEGGFYRETFRAAHSVTGTTREPRAASTAIYFLLPGGSMSALHRVRSDEVWHHYLGDPLTLHLLSTDGTYEAVRLGGRLDLGERPQVVVPANVWQAAVADGDRFTLCGCTVAPGFDFADFEMPRRAEMAATFPQHQTLLSCLCRP
jgi:predicted cupin superfamily sugar epimerase